MIETIVQTYTYLNVENLNLQQELHTEQAIQRANIIAEELENNQRMADRLKNNYIKKVRKLHQRWRWMADFDLTFAQRHLVTRPRDFVFDKLKAS